MAANIGDVRNLVIPRVQDTKPVLTITAGGGVDKCITAALAEHQAKRPRQRAKLVTGNGGFDYPISDLTGFVDGFSIVTQVIYPWSAATPEPTVLERESYALVRLDADALKLRFFTVKPTASEQFLASYTAPHTLTDAACSLPSSEDEALADLAAAHCCEAIAGYYSQSTDNLISADVVQRVSKADSYRASAKRWREAYASKMQADRAVGPASYVTDALTTYPSGQRYHFHGRH